MGRAKVLSEAQVKRAEQMLLADKSFEEVAAELGGISVVGLRNQHFKGGKQAPFAKHGKVWPRDR